MFRLIGSIQSRTDERRPLAVFKVVEYLVTHPGVHRTVDLEEVLEGQVKRGAISLVLNNLGDDSDNSSACGILHYQSPGRDHRGQKVKGWSGYILRDEEKLHDVEYLYQEMRKKRKAFKNRSFFNKIINYILQYPDTTFTWYDLGNALNVYPSDISNVLTFLSNIGALSHQSVFKGGDTVSQAEATDLTKMFYDEVLLPIKEVADTLTPLPNRPLVSTKLSYFLDNYQQERSHIGPKGGDETRGKLIEAMQRIGEPVKLSHLAELINQENERKPGRSAFGRGLNLLVQEGIVRRVGNGFYELI
ncbi:hypothetical protein HYS92_01390 [Candidatus Daviesbacteria bacterium]|nr:hypothetical protein [Candidatus Daviesbacteria bacterium]